MVADQVEDLKVLLDGRRAVLVGHSYGGNVALAASVALVGQVPAVSVFETPLSWMPWWPGTTAGGASVAASPAACFAARPAEVFLAFRRGFVVLAMAFRGGLGVTRL